jgi:hypothetical protein
MFGAEYGRAALGATNDIYLSGRLLMRRRENRRYNPKPKQILFYECYSCPETGATLPHRQTQRAGNAASQRKLMQIVAIRERTSRHRSPAALL